MLKKCFFSLLLLVGVSVYAAEVDFIIFHLNSGVKIFVPIQEYPKIVVENQVVLIKTERYLVSNVNKYTFAKNNDESGSNVSFPNVFSAKDGFIYIRTKKSNCQVNVYSVNGISQDVNTQMSGDGTLEINIGKLQHGVYIITIDGESIKVQL